MTNHLPTVLRRADAGTPVARIAADTGLSSARVYGILREHRPYRKRSSRTRTSTIPAKIRALAAAGATPQRVQELLRVSKAYVYRHYPKLR